jgi:hypothetical protein
MFVDVTECFAKQTKAQRIKHCAFSRTIVSNNQSILIVV